MTARVDVVVRRFYAYRIAGGASFVSAFLVAFLAANGVSFSTVGLGVTALSAVNVVGEVPAGYVGDRFGRRTAMVAANVLSAVISTGWIVARSAPAIVALYAAMGVVISLTSGAATSWLYDALDEHDATDRYAAVAGRSVSLLRATTAVTSLVGAGLYVLSPVYPFLASALAGWVGVVVALSLPANARFRAAASDRSRTDADSDGAENAAGSTDDDPVGPLEAARAMRTFVQRPAVRTVVAFSAVFASAIVLAGRYIQPVVEQAVTETDLAIAGFGVQGVVVLGVVGAVYTTISAIAVDYADVLADRVGRGPAIAGTYGACGLAMLAPVLAWHTSIHLVLAAAVAAVVFRSLPSVAAVVRNAYLHEHADSVTRATTMSAVMFASSLVRMPVVLAGGVLADAYTPGTAVVAAGAGALLVGGVIVLVDGPLTVGQASGSTVGSEDVATGD